MGNHDQSGTGSRWRSNTPGSGWSIAAAIALMGVLRLALVALPTSVDEGGYLLVARQWHTGGPFVYGRLFVDRPPGLLLIFRLADALGGIVALRLMALASAAAMVVAAGWAGRMISGTRGSRWAALTAAALASTPVLGAEQVDGELLAAPLVLLSCALVLVALTPGRSASKRALLIALAGLAAAAAVLVKQNFFDAFVFVVVLMIAAMWTRRLPVSTGARILGIFFAGAAVPLLAVVAWAEMWGTGWGHLWFAVYGFRSEALSVIVRHSPAEMRSRLFNLLADGFLNGMVLLAAGFVGTRLTSLRQREPVTVAVAAMLAFAVPGVALGGNYWSHYLIELVPALTLASACMAGATVRWVRWGRAVVVVVVASAVVGTVATVVAAPVASHRPEAVMQAWLQRSARRSDSIVVSYGFPDLVEASGLRPGYPYVWRLPIQTLDPHLRRLTRTLDGTHAPTWVVEWDRFTSWGADAGERVAAAVSLHYRKVAEVAGHAVYLHRGISRRAAPAAGPSSHLVRR